MFLSKEGKSDWGVQMSGRGVEVKGTRMGERALGRSKGHSRKEIKENGISVGGVCLFSFYTLGGQMDGTTGASQGRRGLSWAKLRCPGSKGGQVGNPHLASKVLPGLNKNLKNTKWWVYSVFGLALGEMVNIFSSVTDGLGLG